MQFEWHLCRLLYLPLVAQDPLLPLRHLCPAQSCLSLLSGLIQLATWDIGSRGGTLPGLKLLDPGLLLSCSST